MKTTSKKHTITFATLENLPDLYFLLDGQGKILRVNRQVPRRLHSEGDDFSGVEFTSLLHPASVLLVENALIEALESGSSRSIEGRFKEKDGEYFESEIYFSPYEINRTPYLLAFIIDVAEQRKRERELLRFKNIAESTINPIQITDLSGKMIYVNPAYERISGYGSDELIGVKPGIFGSDKHSTEFWDEMWETVSSGKAWEGEIENRKKNGEPIDMHVLISPIKNENGEIIGYFGLHRDLTEKKVMEKQLIHTSKMESIGTLAAGVAHEVGNPLASISALVQIVQRSSDDDFIKEKIGLVTKQVNRISKIIRDLVDFSRPSNFQLQSTDINNSLKESIEIVRVGAKTKHIDFEYDLDKDVPILPLVSDQIQQVFVNILINAVDAINEKKAASGEGYTGKITAATEQDGEFATITIADNGPGITEPNQNKVFEPFFTTKKEGKGTGLGLWVSYGIVQSFKGKIFIESVPGESTAFIIKLPINPIY